MPSRWELAEALDVRPAAGWTIETVVQPSPFFGVNGIRIGPDDQCWVAQHRAGVLSSWDAETGRIEVRSPLGGPIANPDDLAFGADGTAYVTELSDGCVRALRPDGSCVTVCDDAPRANGITVAAGGRVFVTEFRAEGRLLEVDPFELRPPRVVVEHAPWGNAFDAGPDGRLYYQDVLAGTVSSVDPDAGDVRVELVGLRMPAAVKFRRDGRLVVAESALGTITAIDLATGAREVLGTLDPGIDNFCFDRQDRLYGSRNATSQLVRFAAGADQVDRQTDAGLLGPQDLAASDGGEVLVVDVLSIHRLDDHALSPVWQLRMPEAPYTAMGVAEVKGSLLIVAGNGEVHRVDTSNGMGECVSEASAGAYHVQAPGGATAIASTDGGAIVGTRDGRLRRLGADGVLREERASGLEQVTAVACSGPVVAACDRDAERVAIFDGGGGPRLLEGLGPIEALAVGPEGLFAAEARGGSVSLIAYDGSSATPLVTGLPFGLPKGVPRGDRRASLLRVAENALLVGCDGDGSVRGLRQE